MPLSRPLATCLRFAASLALLTCSPSIAADRTKEDAVDRFIRTEMVKRHIPGVSLTIVKDGKIIKAEGYGFANLEHGTPATARTVYDLGSIGKQFTATATMLLVERGKMSLDERIRHYLPSLPKEWDSVRVRNLLNHTSGIPDYMSAPGVNPKGDYSDEQLVALAAKRPLHFKPGEGWRYGNTNYLLLGGIIRSVAGMPWTDFLDKAVFQPQGMTTMRPASRGEIVPNRAAGYDGDGKTKAFYNTGYMSPSLLLNGSGGLLGTAIDLAKWDAALYDERVLKQSSLTEMWRPTVLKDGTTKNYGFGWEVEDWNGHRRIHHSGGLPGFETHISRFVEDKLTVIILTNVLMSNPWEMSSVVAGMYNPALAPKPKPAVPKS